MRGYFPTNVSDYTIDQCKEYLSNYPNGLNAEAVKGRLSLLLSNSRVSTNPTSNQLSRNMIFSKVRDIIAEKLCVDPCEITEDSNIEVDFGADSLDVVELTMELEKAYGIRIDDVVISDIATVKQVVDTIDEMKKV